MSKEIPMKHTRLMLAVAAAVCLSASVWAQSGSRVSGHANVLTTQEQQEGWVLLCHGTTSAKWTATPALAEVFTVADGAIKSDRSDAGEAMLTKETFDAFVLEVEVRAHPDINSAIILRSPPP